MPQRTEQGKLGHYQLARSRDIMTAEELSRDTAHREEKRMAIAYEILRVDPSIGFVTAIIIAGDRLSAERAQALVESGAMKAVDAMNHVGSHARLDFAYRMHEAGKITRDTLLKNLPSLWRVDPARVAIRYEATA